MSTKILTDTRANLIQSQEFLLPSDHPLSEYDNQGLKLRKQEYDHCRWGKMSLHPDGGVSPCWGGWFQTHDLDNWRTKEISEIWNGDRYRRSRFAACNGGNANGELVCERCAFSRSFGPTPDGEREPAITKEHISNAVSVLRNSGCPPVPEIVSATVDAIVATRPASDLSASA